MSSSTTVPGLISIDPVQGLVDYVNDIKPFHTKIFQVLFEYVYADNDDATVVDTMQMQVVDNTTNITSPTDPAIGNEGGIPANGFWFNPTLNTLFIRGNYLNPQFNVGTNVLVLAGNYVPLFVVGKAFNISGTATVNDGDYTVATATFDGAFTQITTTPNPVNATPGTASFVALPANIGALVWNGYQLYVVNGTNSTSIPNVLVQTSPPPYGTPAAYWFNPTTNSLFFWNGTSYVAAILSSGILGYWNQYIHYVT